MSLRFTNSLTSRTEAFEPLTAGKASIYCCGVTVYDLCHLGHARSYINWDVLRRYLIWRGDDVTYIQNYTDIDDKILKRASEEGSTMTEVSERNIDAFFQHIALPAILNASINHADPRVQVFGVAFECLFHLLGQLASRLENQALDSLARL